MRFYFRFIWSYLLLLSPSLSYLSYVHKIFTLFFNILLRLIWRKVTNYPGHIIKEKYWMPDSFTKLNSCLKLSYGRRTNMFKWCIHLFNSWFEFKGEEDEEKGDKKTVRQILSQLLSNNQPSHQVNILRGLPVIVSASFFRLLIRNDGSKINYLPWKMW